jgi:ATP-binding cassette, subfamily G (WHITE), member 2, PDR
VLAKRENSVLASPQILPRFWIFMYRVSPFTYLVSGMISVGLANSEVVCNPIEYLHFNPPSGKTCIEYMETYISMAGGYLLDENASTDCNFCSVRDTNTFLKTLNSDFSLRWRNFGLMWVFIVFNVFAAVGMYWLARVPKVKKAKKEKSE